MNSWLENIKVGDTVIVTSSGYYGQNSISKVDRLTKTQVILEGSSQKYRRDDGWAVGRSSYSSRMLKEGTVRAIAELREDIRFSRARNFVSNTNWTNVDKEKIDAIYLILKG